MRDGVRFAGLEELLLKLDEVADAWAADPQLEPIAFLVRRATADFETAIEAGLSGYPTVAADAMRDVMEIELLLLDFYVDPERVRLWLNADRATRLRDFAPGALRRRLIDLGLHEIVGTADVQTDYQAHSEALHVTPHQIPVPFLFKGYVDAQDVISLDSSFVEIFEHGRRLGNALVLVASQLSPDSSAEEACKGPLKAFELAHERTQELLGQFLELLRQVASEEHPP
jgi:hypothetical protein